MCHGRWNFWICLAGGGNSDIPSAPTSKPQRPVSNDAGGEAVRGFISNDYIHRYIVAEESSICFGELLGKEHFPLNSHGTRNQRCPRPRDVGGPSMPRVLVGADRHKRASPECTAFGRSSRSAFIPVSGFFPFFLSSFLFLLCPLTSPSLPFYAQGLGIPLGSFGSLTFASGLDCEPAESGYGTGRPKPAPSHLIHSPPSGPCVPLAKIPPLDYQGPIECGYTSTLVRCQLAAQAHGGPTNQRRLAKGTDNVPRQ